jgi:hypothetical protein
MTLGDQRSGQNNHRAQHERPGHGDSAAGMMAMMAMMMSMCLGIVLLFAVIPAVGLPVGLAIAAGGAAIMLFVHGRMMRRGGR